MTIQCHRHLRPLISRLMSSKQSHLRGPNGFSTARRRKDNCTIVENRPYVPSLFVNLQDEATVVNAARVILSNYNDNCSGIQYNNEKFDTKVSIMSGGLTNALYMVEIDPETTVLVRIFGAEGMIDRDIETANFARLCHAKNSVAHRDLDYLGRFGNGRVETLIPNMRAATNCDLRKNEYLALEVTRQMARLHHQFDIPDYLLEGDASHEGRMNRCFKPVMWKVLSSWKDELVSSITQACSRDHQLVDIFVSALFGDTLHLDSIISESDNDDHDDKKNESSLTIVMSHIEQQLTNEIHWIQAYISNQHPDAPLAFCHNDINAANILYSVNTKCHDKDSVALIDYEYGAINYTMYDLANFICEHCGGNDNGIPDYNSIPSLELQRKFVKEYIRERDRVLPNTNTTTTPDEQEESVTRYLNQVQTFQLLSHLYWGYWGILQGVNELPGDAYDIENIKLKLRGEVEQDTWDNLRYGKNRLARYREQKQLITEK